MKHQNSFCRTLPWITGATAVLIAAACDSSGNKASGGGGTSTTSGGGGASTTSGGSSSVLTSSGSGRDAGASDGGTILGGSAFSEGITKKTAPAFVSGGSAPPAAPGAAVAVKVSTSNVLRPIPRTLFGNNTAVWDGSTLLSDTTVARLKAVNVSLLRFPGGSTSDQYHWDGVYPPYAVAQKWDQLSQSWAVSTAQYMGLVSKLGATPLLTVNYGYATYDTTATDGKVANAARLAADWVEYCNSPNDGSNPNGGTDWAAKRASDGSATPYGVRYWEIGNEVFGNWETGYDATGSTYAKNFNTIADAMRAVDPTIKIGLVVETSQENEPWTKTVLSNPGTVDRADFLIVHNYFAWYMTASDVSATALLPKSSQVGQQKGWLDELVQANTTKAKDSLPYYLGEFNLPAPTNPLQSSLVSGLFISKVLGELATTGWAAASLWDVMNGWETTSPLDAGGGDMGFLSRNQPNVPDLTPRPSYYAYYFYTRNFGDHLVGLTSSEPSVIGYASTFDAGGAGVVLVNEGTASKTVTLTFDGMAPASPANAWMLTGTALDNLSVTLNGQGSGAVAGGPVPDTVKPYVVTPASGKIVVDVPALSVTSLVVYP